MLRATFATLAVASALVLSAPFTASAAPAGADCSGTSMSYANSVIVTSDSPSFTPGGTSTITFSAGYFAPSDTVTVSVSGVNASSVSLQAGSATGLGSVVTAADGSGALVVNATFPQSAEGTYQVSGVSDSGCGGVGVASDVVSDPASTASTGAAAATGELAFTGTTLPTILLVTGGGALVFGSILLMIRSRSRRHHAE